MARATPQTRQTRPHATPARVADGDDAAPRADTRRIKVRALRMGYYDDARRREGDVFTVEARHVTETWMARVRADTPENTTTGQAELRRQHDEILRTRMPAAGTPLVDDVLPTGAQNPLDV